MSTTASSSQPVPATEQTKNAGRSVQSWLIVLLVFIGGISSLGTEMAASRLLSPYFGSSLFVWANLIGLVLLCLTLGYYLGGRIADRYPYVRVLYTLTAIAALMMALIPVVSRPILQWSLTAFSTYSVGVFYGSLVSVILLLAPPTILLGCVSPYAIRLSVDQVGRAGRIAGMLYAISTAGSIIGTIVPVFFLIPYIGTYATFLVMSGMLLTVSVLGLIFTQLGGKKNSIIRSFLYILLFIPLLLAPLGLQGSIKPAVGSNGGGVLLDERESNYNYIQIVQVGEQKELILNEGVGVHSIYNPNQLLTRGPWDYFMVAPYFNNAPFKPEQIKNMCIIGLGAGTTARQFTEVYGPIAIDGVELDPAIVEMGKKHFEMNEPNLTTIVQDGRNYLTATQKKYDVIGIDAYQQPYVPFQLTTVEFFQEVRNHLTPTGVTVINAGRTGKDYRLVDALAQTMRSVFPNVYIIDSERFTNSLVIGTNDTTSLANFKTNTESLQNPVLQSVVYSSNTYGKIREETQAIRHFTDDRAPVEQLIDLIILDAVR